MSDTLTFSAASALNLEPRLPPNPSSARTSTEQPQSRPFVTLTFATSLDSSLSLAPGVRTRLSGPDSKAMTHYLRSRHDAILVGVSTMLADDPALNCRIQGANSQPRPIIIDPHLRWTPQATDKVLQTCKFGRGLAPFIITTQHHDGIPTASREVLESHGGRYIQIPAQPDKATSRSRFDWRDIMTALHETGLSSVMVEGGANIINSLLHPDYHSLVDSVIVTIAPTWLGQGGVVVSPERVHDEKGTPAAAARLCDVSWIPFGEDVVLCGKLQTS
ncbi:hypothetical protein VHEMI03531 [[Torrubiella] hemipterigena]|uniref:2,5-diamino-6-ribosylamino-4(3H)-pyrimidinone 5'-phosphate reductase n=1 Tax=[Torrubiella] hemipterigena TaxID=1531966 RepID=A0A0A1SSS4_9HYPO|nr:hypothetical protein VHEMI03531 [[Torrubiella] hemipterigena]